MAENNVIVEYHNKVNFNGIKNKWWLEKAENQFESINAVISHIDDSQVYRQTAFLKHARLYHNLELLGFNPNTHAKISEYPTMNNRVTFNVVKSCVDTVQSKIAKHKPRPVFLTEDGDWSLQRKAKLLTQYLEGLFYGMDVYTKGKSVFRDGEVFGTGIMKLYPCGNKIECERVLPSEIKVDDAEGMYGCPRQLHQTKYVSRDVLIDMFPDKAHEIISCQSADNADMVFYQIADLVEVNESWHLPSGEDAGDGSHCIVIENATLLSEPYEKDYFPFVFIRWTDRLIGFWGQGLAEELLGIQLELNKLLRLVQTAIHLVSNPRVMVEDGTITNLQHINNEIAGILKYRGTKPEFVTPTAISAEVYAHIENLYRKAYEISGVSMLSANSAKPEGLDSGKALREFQDIESDRFQIVGQAYEDFYMNIAKICIDMTRDLNKKHKQSVKSVNGKFIKQIKWSEIDLDESNYVMKVFPTSALPSTPAGKLSSVTELVQAGFIDRDMAMSLLDFPDLEAFNSLQNASVDITKKMIEVMTEEGIYETPEPEMNLELAKNMAQNAYLKYRTNGLEEERLDLLRRFIQDCKDMMEMAMPEPQPQIPMGAGQMPVDPMATPMANPVSDILPIGGQ